jgi:PAS domain S-box-containing protein
MDSSPEPTRPRLVIPYIVLGVSLLVTFLAAAYVAVTAARRDQTRFDNAIDRTQTAIVQRIDTYVNLLKGTAGLFAIDQKITRKQFQAYVERLQFTSRYPGIQGIGVSARIPPGQFNDLIQRMNGEWNGGFHIFPETRFDERHAIIYLEPQNPRNRAAIGYDMFTESRRHAAMEAARDTGEPAMSGKVRLVQELNDARGQAGFLIYVPVYFNNLTPREVGTRRIALAGFVYAPFRGDDLLNGIFGPAHSTGGVNFTIYDGETSDDNDVIHRSDADDPQPIENARFVRTLQVKFLDRPWTIKYRTGSSFETNSLRGLTLMVIALGGIVSCLLFALSASQAASQQRIEKVAEELRASEQALRSTESRFRRLVDSNLIGVVFSSLDGRVIDGNDEYFRIVGRRRDEALAGKVRWDGMTPPEYAHADRRAVSELRAVGVCTPFEKEFIRPEGSRVPVLVGVAMLEGSDNETVAMYVDLTQRKQAEHDILRAKEAAEAAQADAERAQADAEQASRIKDEFLATVSHELRTPLNAILGWSQLLRGQRHDADELKHGLETIERSAKAQAQLIDDLLDVSRIIAGKLRLDMKVVALATVIESALESVRPAADAKGVRLIHRFSEYAVPVHGDPNRLQQIVWNLLSNAVKFTPKGGLVQVAIEHDDSSARIIVSDTGIGIAPGFLPYVFERFRQADASTTRRYGGLGLGLGIVRHLTELHGGTVHAESEGEGRGAKFVITLPLAVAHTNEAPIAPPPLENGVSLRGVRVLLVEDDADARDLVTRVLRECGADVSAAASAAEAMDLFRAGRPDVLVSDIGMPDQDGYALMTQIRALGIESGRHVPAIALTALARPEDRRRAILAGFEVHVAKPVEPAELAAVVAHLAVGKPGGGQLLPSARTPGGGQT